MKAELYLRAETDLDEEELQAWKEIHLQTYVQDFLEGQAYKWNTVVDLPDMVYIGKDGKIIAEVRQEDKVAPNKIVDERKTLAYDHCDNGELSALEATIEGHESDLIDFIHSVRHITGISVQGLNGALENLEKNMRTRLIPVQNRLDNIRKERAYRESLGEN